MAQRKKSKKGTFSRMRLPVSPDYVVPQSRRWSVIAALAGLAVILGAVFLGTIREGGDVLSPGRVTSAHASFEERCDRCHQSPELGVSAVNLDTRCTDCHETTRASGTFSFARHYVYHSDDHDRTQARGVEGRCADCHDEHHGREHDLSAIDDRACTTCHAFESFTAQHPEFDFAAQRLVDDAGLRFQHLPHMREIARRQGLAADELTQACFVCHQPTANGARFAPIDFDHQCSACHLNGGTATDWLPVATGVSSDGGPGVTAVEPPGVLSLAVLRASDGPQRALLEHTSPDDFRSRDGGRLLRKLRVTHRDPWILANLRRLRHILYPGEHLADLLEASGDVAPTEARAIYAEALTELRTRARVLRSTPARSVQRDLDEIDKQIAALEQRIAEPHTVLAVTPFALGPGDRNQQLTPEAFAHIESFVDTLTTACRSCHVIENASIARVEKDQRALDRARFDHSAHALEMACLDCHHRVPLNAELVLGDGTFDMSLDQAAILNLPAKDTCSACHAESKVSSRCTTCHDFHPDKLRDAHHVLGGR